MHSSFSTKLHVSPEKSYKKSKEISAIKKQMFKSKMKVLLKHYQAFATEEKAQPNKLFNKKKISFDANTHMFTFLAILVQMTGHML